MYTYVKKVFYKDFYCEAISVHQQKITCYMSALYVLTFTCIFGQGIQIHGCARRIIFRPTDSF